MKLLDVVKKEETRVGVAIERACARGGIEFKNTSDETATAYDWSIDWNGNEANVTCKQCMTRWNGKAHVRLVMNHATVTMVFKQTGFFQSHPFAKVHKTNAVVVASVIFALPAGVV